MEVFLIVLGCLAVMCTTIIICASMSNSSTNSLVEQDVNKSCSSGKCSPTVKNVSTNKKTFPTMKKGSRFIIEGRIAEKITDGSYRFIDSMETMYWLARDLHYYQMMSEPSHSYEATPSNDDKNVSVQNEPSPVPVPIIIPSPIGTPIEHYNTPVPNHSSYSNPSPSHSSHSSHDSGSSSSHSSCSSSSASSCSSSSGSSCSSSSCGGSSCGGGGGD